MARRRRSSLPDLQDGRSLEELWQDYVELTRPKAFTRNPHAFAIRRLVKPGLWYIPASDDPEAFAEAHRRGILTRNILQQRIHLMSTNPIPSSPRRPPTHVIRFYDGERLLAVHSFVGAAACHSMIKLVAGTQATSERWLSSEGILLGNGISVSSPQLEEIMETTSLPTLPQPYPGFANAIARRSIHDDDSPAPPPKLEPREPRTPRPRPAGDTITPADLATELNASPSTIRSLLRKHLTKPTDGWQWPQSELPALLAKLRPHV